jgi:hypothetical protein
MNRRDLFRIAGAGMAAGVAAPAREFSADYNASKGLAAADWKPAFLDEHQCSTLAVFGDLVVPGAKDALAHRFIDRILNVETRAVQQNFLNALAFVDGESTDRYRAPFIDAPRDRQIELVTHLAVPPANPHFRVLKDWVAKAYYSSEMGQRDLGWDGTPPHGTFAGCGS